MRAAKTIFITDEYHLNIMMMNIILIMMLIVSGADLGAVYFMSFPVISNYVVTVEHSSKKSNLSKATSIGTVMQ